MENPNLSDLAMQTLKDIPEPSPNAPQINSFGKREWTCHRLSAIRRTRSE